MEPTGVIEEPSMEPVSIAVEERQVSLDVLARVQALQNALLALEAQVAQLRTEQLRLIAEDTGADLQTQTWVIDVQNGRLVRHEVQVVITPEPTPELESAKKPRRKAASAARSTKRRRRADQE